MECKTKPIFIIGSYRSGTSILTWCLGQHPNVMLLEETGWIARLSMDLDCLYFLGLNNKEHSHLGSIGITKNEFYQYFGVTLNNFINDNKMKYIKKSLSNILTENGFDSTQKGNILNDNKRVLGEYIKRSPEHFKVIRSELDLKNRFVDGTPENSHYVFGLLKLFPNAKFIHILRNPKQVARSLMHFSSVGQRDYAEEEAYNTWFRLVKASVNAERALGRERIMRIHYDELVNDSERTISKCLKFLEEPYCSDCLLPLKEKINSSSYDKTDDYSIETNINSENEYERKAFQLYNEIISKQNFSKKKFYYFKLIGKEFYDQAKYQRPDAIENLARWGHKLTEEIELKDRRIVQLQKEYDEVGIWYKRFLRIKRFLVSIIS